MIFFSFSLFSTTRKKIAVVVVVVNAVVVAVVEHPRVGLRSRELKTKKMRGKLELACISFIAVQCCQMKIDFSHLSTLYLQSNSFEKEDKRTLKH